MWQCNDNEMINVMCENVHIIKRSIEMTWWRILGDINDDRQIVMMMAEIDDVVMKVLKPLLINEA